jgi:hypothetical protein
MSGRPTPVWEAVVRVRGSSAGSSPHDLRVGRDVVLDMPRAQGDELPRGVLLDDLLAPEQRDAIDREAIERLRAWRQRRDAELTVDGVCMPNIWEVELLAEVFLPETRIAAGLLAAFEQAPPRRVECEGLDAGRVATLRAVLGPLGVEVLAAGPPAPPPRYPSVLASPARIALSRRVAKSILQATGAPQRVRGEVFFLPYWHLLPVLERLSASGPLDPVLDPGAPPRAALATLLRCALRGGWVGYPGLRRRRWSRRSLERRLASARGAASAEASLSGLLDTRALTMLEQRAGGTLAAVSQLREAFAGRRIRLAVLPFDSPPEARVVVQAARDCGVPTLVVQHGLFNEPNDPDKTLADCVAVWSDADAADLREWTPAAVVTGNPGAGRPPALRDRRRAGPREQAIVLVEYASRLSTRVDNRVSVRHVLAALDALSKALPGASVTIRPHPAEHEPEIFERLAAAARGLEVGVDVTSPIDDVLRTADLCVGAVSTATLEAAAAGVPVVFLNVTEKPARWPFDGSTDVPVACSSEELAEVVPRVLASGGVPGRAEMLEALGARADALDRVVGLIERLAAGGAARQ